MEVTLDRLCPGQSAVVVSIDTQPYLRERLTDFGFVPGTAVRCCYRSPGCHISALGCRGAVLAIRNRDLKHIRGDC